jgi:hypothetical protein
MILNRQKRRYPKCVSNRNTWVSGKSRVKITGLLAFPGNLFPVHY